MEMKNMILSKIIRKLSRLGKILTENSDKNNIEKEQRTNFDKLI
jgi:hypothetical protein